MEVKKTQKIITPASAAVLAVTVGMLVWFLLPGFFNEGTFLGVMLCAVIAGCVLLRSRIAELLKRLWKRIPGRIAVCAAGAAVIGFVGFCGYNCVMMADYSDKPLEQIRCVMILGCQVRGREPGGDMLSRLSTALPLLEEYAECPVIVTGGQGAGEDISEAECMKQWLISRGIAEDRIYTEDRSHSTATNFVNSAPILEELGISDGIAVVTNDFHQYRSEIYASRLGLSVGHYSAATGLRVLPNYIIRELAALFFV